MNADPAHSGVVAMSACVPCSTAVCGSSVSEVQEKCSQLMTAE